ncbi:hypothetical protein EVAR_793_1 [Eumeta japonica]|uniref:Uncharacterized protein n=1 Tax=Eumeta variegata TaxID=151549 RepID=A0A4C1SEA7_EUMVA|nr:hypothetical protein EVAR_793_1 [Eumeta japonica]
MRGPIAFIGRSASDPAGGRRISREIRQRASSAIRSETEINRIYQRPTRRNRNKSPPLDELYDAEIILDVKDYDKIQKEKGKEYGDRKRRAIDFNLGEGDEVYKKNM